MLALISILASCAANVAVARLAYSRAVACLSVGRSVLPLRQFAVARFGQMNQVLSMLIVLVALTWLLYVWLDDVLWYVLIGSDVLRW